MQALQYLKYVKQDLWVILVCHWWSCDVAIETHQDFHTASVKHPQKSPYAI